MACIEVALPGGRRALAALRLKSIEPHRQGSQVSSPGAMLPAEKSAELLRRQRRHRADVGQITIAFSVIHSVSDDEEIGNGEPDIIRIYLLHTPGRLVQQGGDAQRFGVLLEEQLAQVGERQPGVENIL